MLKRLLKTVCNKKLQKQNLSAGSLSHPLNSTLKEKLSQQYFISIRQISFQAHSREPMATTRELHLSTIILYPLRFQRLFQKN